MDKSQQFLKELEDLLSEYGYDIITTEDFGGVMAIADDDEYVYIVGDSFINFFS